MSDGEMKLKKGNVSAFVVDLNFIPNYFRVLFSYFKHSTYFNIFI